MTTERLDLLESYGRALDELADLESKMAAAWGDKGDGKTSLCQGIQLAQRIGVADRMLAELPNEPLDDAAKARSDQADVRRCIAHSQSSLWAQAGGLARRAGQHLPRAPAPLAPPRHLCSGDEPR